jgi:hypothetical protein
MSHDEASGGTGEWGWLGRMTLKEALSQIFDCDCD